MPKGEPNPQTRATDKYQKKKGIISKSYKMKKTLADEFKAACEERRTGQSDTVRKLMEGYISGKFKTD